jgi:hypothetical protein
VDTQILKGVALILTGEQRMRGKRKDLKMRAKERKLDQIYILTGPPRLCFHVPFT